MAALPMLDAFIGIVTIYFTLSLTVTAFSELIIQWCGLHAKSLCTLITNMTESGMCKKMLSHPRIEGLKVKTSRNPSRIPEDTFVYVLLDCYLEGEYLKNRKSPKKICELLREKAGLECTDEDRLAYLDKSWQQQIYSYWQQSNDNPKVFEQYLECWFRDAGERCRDWFKRKIQTWVLLPIGLLVSIIINVNTIDMYRLLLEDPILREQQVAFAKQIMENQDFQTINCVIPGVNDQPENPMAKTCEELAREMSVDMPPIVGWNESTPLVKAYEEAGSFSGLIEHSPWLLIKNILGWLITAIALSLGSPFWFDVINRLLKARERVRSISDTDDEERPMKEADPSALPIRRDAA
ncbi:hypothetical protein [Sessilibacter corallicola]|uniref:Uncharacterized protein n=1 Tax=Sessilibacter corallicola TaxID=2904075 RepID=A0ABQ0ACA2_9GAMM